MTDLAISNVFVSGTTIVAADVNENFDDVKALVNTTGVPKLQDGIVSSAKLASGLVLATVPHTWALKGVIAVPVGDTDYIPPMFVPVPSGRTAKLVAVRYRINAGTSATFKLQVNGSDATGFTALSATTTSATTNPADVSLADGDALAMVVTAVSGSPFNMTVTAYLEYGVA